MPLFIDRLPFACWIDRTRTPPKAPARPPSHASFQQWVLDTRNRGAAFAWRRHLLDAGLDPDANRSPGSIVVASSVGGKAVVPIRLADLWLVSNLPAPRPVARWIRLFPGIPFHIVSALPDPQFHRPLIGLQALRSAGLRVEIDFAADVVSVWTP